MELLPGSTDVAEPATVAICGPRRGDDLEIVPSTVTTWGAWLDERPDSLVLLPPPASSVGNPPYPE